MDVISINIQNRTIAILFKARVIITQYNRISRQVHCELDVPIPSAPLVDHQITAVHLRLLKAFGGGVKFGPVGFKTITITG